LKKSIRNLIMVICIIILNIAIIFTYKFFFINENVNLSINWKIDIPKPKNIEVLYNYEYRDGEDLEIWYYEKENIEEIVNNNNFKNIDEENKSFIYQKMNDYYIILDEDKKKLFDENVSIERLITEENYFAFNTSKDNEESWILLILDYKTGKLYYFVNVY